MNSVLVLQVLPHKEKFLRGTLDRVKVFIEMFPVVHNSIADDVAVINASLIFKLYSFDVFNFSL